MTLRFVSLFAGAGGFDLAFERAGFAPAAMCEIDPHAQAVLRYHWPEVPLHDDVTTFTAARYGTADVVTFGSPCQDLSVAGKRKGMAGERSGLFMEAVRVIREMREESRGRFPRFAVWENVPGAYSSAGGRDFAAVLEELVGGEVGVPRGGWPNAGVAFGPYGQAAWRTLDSQHFGVPQRRRRIFLVADFAGERAGEILFERQGVRGDTAEGGEAGEGTTRGLVSGIEQSGRIYDELGVAATLDARHAYDPMKVLAFQQNTRDEVRLMGGDGRSVATNPLRVSQTEAVAYGVVSKGNGEAFLIPERHMSLSIGGGQAGQGYAAVLSLATEYLTPWDCQEKRIFSDRGIAPTLSGSDGGGGRTGVGFVETGYAVRRLTPVECERLQGFPDGWTALGDYGGEVREVSDTQRYKLMGNAVTVNVVEWLARRMRCAFGTETLKTL